MTWLFFLNQPPQGCLRPKILNYGPIGISWSGSLGWAIKLIIHWIILYGDIKKAKNHYSWGHVLSLKSFCRNPVLSWTIRYSVFQPVKFGNSFEFVCSPMFSTFWYLLVKFGCNKWFLNHFQNGRFSVSGKYRWSKKSLFYLFQKYIFFNFLLLDLTFVIKKKCFEQIEIMIFLFHQYSRMPFWFLISNKL